MCLMFATKLQKIETEIHREKRREMRVQLSHACRYHTIQNTCLISLAKIPMPRWYPAWRWRMQISDYFRTANIKSKHKANNNENSISLRPTRNLILPPPTCSGGIFSSNECQYCWQQRRNSSSISSCRQPATNNIYQI